MPADRPSIKGAIFGFAIDDLRQLVAEKAISRDELAKKLGAGDVDYLDRTILASSWYDVRTYGRLLETLKHIAGEGRNEYLLERGAQSAQRLLDGGRYPQMEYLHRTQMQAAKGPEERARAFGRDLQLLVSLNRALFNFGNHSVKQEPQHPDRYVIEMAEVEAYPEALCWTVQGFMNRMAEEHGHRDLWHWERPRHDTVVFHMNRSL